MRALYKMCDACHMAELHCMWQICPPEAAANSVSLFPTAHAYMQSKNCPDVDSNCGVSALLPLLTADWQKPSAVCMLAAPSIASSGPVANDQVKCRIKYG